MAELSFLDQLSRPDRQKSKRVLGAPAERGALVSKVVGEFSTEGFILLSGIG